MRYEYLISRNLALLDLPVENFGQVKTKEEKQNSFLEKIFRQLLVYDQLPDHDSESVLRETKAILEALNPAFEPVGSDKFASFINLERHKYVWGKVSKDYHAYIRAETKRRNTENPYHNSVPGRVESWDALPDFSRQKRNQPWQFDSLYRDSQILAGQVFGILAFIHDQQDRDVLRAKISSILVPEKIIFALNSNEANLGFSENELTLANIKLTLDAYKQGHTFLNRVIESLHKIRFGNSEQAEMIDQTISFGEKMIQKLKSRISEIERRFILFLEAIEQENREEEE